MSNGYNIKIKDMSMDKQLLLLLFKKKKKKKIGEVRRPSLVLCRLCYLPYMAPTHES